ncbi:MAG: ABA4-like family protein [Burkholderiales bacterium]
MHEALFSAAGTLTLAGWAALALIPLRHRIATPIAVSVAILVATLYVALIVCYGAAGTGDFRSLAGVVRLFEHRGLLLAGWVHYLAFDLLVGTWEREEARRIGLGQGALIPCLALTCLFGPIGWLAFLAVRQLHLRTRGSAALAVPRPSGRSDQCTRIALPSETGDGEAGGEGEMGPGEPTHTARARFQHKDVAVEAHAAPAA